MSTDDKPTRARGGQPRNGSARKHGHHARKLKLTDVRLVDISQQNGPGRLVAAKAEAIFADRGGRENLTELQQDLVNRYLVTELLIQSIDFWLLEQKSIINKRKKTAIPILTERNRLTETSLKLAQAIGLERKEPPAPSLAEFLAQRKVQGEQVPESKAEPLTGAQAQPDERQPLSERPRDVANGRYLPADDGATEPA